MNKKSKKRIFSSNAIRLTLWELVVLAGIMILVIFVALPWVWNYNENIVAGKNFRLGYEYRDNYWTYRSWTEKAVKEYPVLFLGDSVVWGMYVDNDNTIPSKINFSLGRDVVANIAIDGLHSLAMEGLIEYYGKKIENKKILLHYNPLWMNSTEYDLSTKKEMEIHHPRLIPQFSTDLKCYNEDFGKRMGIWCERNLSFFSLLNHIRITFFNNEDFNQWIVDHPYDNPFSKISFDIDPVAKNNINNTIDWEQKGITKQDWDWMPLAQSKQWQAFKRVIQVLKDRNNEILVMVGPINPYLLSEKSLGKYRGLQNDICDWLKQEKIDYLLVPDMPSKMYADASHPLAPGYDLIVKQLLQTKMLKPYEKMN